MRLLIEKLTKGQKQYRRRSKNYFGGSKKLDISKDEMAAYRLRLKAAGLRHTPNKFGGYPAALKKTEAGFCCHTHRARSKWFKRVEDISVEALKFIASTG